ncbi:hypothetical protein DFP72DRAFT_1062363 [Ephemerocybe angulata]|uniref:F-box domain-containing protein n=1 Tax=Ephemerocybe angulata TaxID=980116 RepID=A0A8H6IBE2_9AGAR|nr:hypothetical protein DFP72DRAFT_1062363 [Tulosesus angulatus]
MDNILQIYELTKLVCEEINDSPTLYAMALTCHALSEPSLDVLWRNIYSFEPLLCCLPPDLLYESNFTSEDSVLSKITLVGNRRTPTGADLDRYLSCYARRIQRFVLRPTEKMKIMSTEFLSALKFATGGVPGALCPNIKEFYLLATPWSAHHSIPGLIIQLASTLPLVIGESDSVEAFGVLAASPFSDDVQAIYEVLQRAPCIKTLMLSIDSISPNALTGPIFDNWLAPSWLSPRWTNLEYLQVDSITGASVDHLASLPNLATFILADQTDVLTNPPCVVTSNTEKFRALRELRVHSRRLEIATRLVRHLPPRSSLRILECTTPQPATLNEATDAIYAAEAHTSPFTLESLRLEDCVVPDLDQSQPLDFDVNNPHSPLARYLDANIRISCFLPFSRLRELSLCFYPRVSVSPEDIALIPTSWPNLTVLNLRGTFPILRQPTLDHTHLVYLIERCPSIRVLGLPVDVRRVQGTESIPGGRFPLQKLYVCGSPIDSSERVQAFMQTNLPEVEVVVRYQTWLYTNSESEMVWAEVWGDIGD